MASSDRDRLGLEYWLRWQVAVCALSFAGPLAASLFVIFNKRAKAPPLSFDHLWLPCFRNLNPVWLLCFRAFAFLVLSCFLYRVVADSGLFVFYFYTQWTFALVMVYFALGTIISAYGCSMCSKKPTSKKSVSDELLKPESKESKLTDAATNEFKAQDTNNTIKLQSYYNQVDSHLRAGFWGYLMHAIYQTCAGAAILTDIVFWCILVPLLVNVTFRLSLVIACMHSVNVLFLIIDTSINSLPFSWFGLANFVLWTSIYGVFQWVIHICGVVTWWPYPFLDLSKPSAPLWYIAMALVHIPFFGIYILLVKAKFSIFSRSFPNAFVRH